MTAFVVILVVGLIAGAVALGTAAGKAKVRVDYYLRFPAGE